MELLINLISGAIGGNIAGGLMKSHNLGLFGNSLTGLIGGAVGGRVLSILGGNLGLADAAAKGLDPGLMIAQVAASGTGGGLVMILAALVRNRLTR